ncbi:hypothetical protein [Mesorhizobium sp. B4-1-4]|uniref:hypothetical protein n=1 Tax=Mesorhizobium sp. B4-1-4 TaxID=2589888 RepID=UPI0011270C19|nr:hypothetical protein [Mesorhizobium sp. B4-1-4]UCI31919.1 hypothetical protein FJW03_00035 [Mesorhizobium sp. B4-1-4]
MSAGIMDKIGCQPWTDLEKRVMHVAIIAQGETARHPPGRPSHSMEVAQFFMRGDDVGRLPEMVPSPPL